MAKKSDAKKARNEVIIKKAIAGVKTKDLAKEYGVHRQAISTILNSDQAKQIAKEAENAVYNLAQNAIDALTEAVNQRDDVKAYLKASEVVLRSLGAIKDRVNMSENFPAPTVIHLRNGDKIIAGVVSDQQIAEYQNQPNEESEGE